MLLLFEFVVGLMLSHHLFSFLQFQFLKSKHIPPFQKTIQKITNDKNLVGILEVEASRCQIVKDSD